PFLRDAVAVTVRRAVQDENVRAGRYPRPLGGELVFVEVEGPVEEPRLPGRAVDAQALPLGAAVLQVGPGKVARDQLGHSLKDKVMVAGDADDLAGRGAAQPAAKLAVEPGGLEVLAVIADGA